jgi:uncharacterized lipoprotein YbaY
MILLLHIIIALTSVAFTTYLMFAPSRTKLRASYALVAATLASGTLLVVQHPAHLLQSCLSGFTYTLLMTALVAVVRYRLAQR